MGGPTGVNVVATANPANINLYPLAYTVSPSGSGYAPAYLGFGNASNYGITFQASWQNSGNGEFYWAQVLNSDSLVAWSGGQQNVFAPTIPPSQNGPPVLDGDYPYWPTFDNPESDSPTFPIQGQQYSEETEAFGATMYLMWAPEQDPSCFAGDDCVIDVPLGYVQWG